MSLISLGASWIAWRYIPDYISKKALQGFHQIGLKVFGRQPPPPNTPQWNKERRIVFAIVLFSYAFYTFHSAASSIPPNYYQALGVTPTADEADLKAGFRAFAKRFHPDRAGPEMASLFIEIRDAYDALKDPVTRFAYDRFGPTALKWKHCTTMQEYITHGLSMSTAYYVISICVLVFWNRISPRDLAFWNYILLFGTFVYELLYVLGPSPTAPSSLSISSLLFTDPASPSRNGILGYIWPQRVAYQHIMFIKSLTLLFSSMLYQVIPVLFPPSTVTVKPTEFVQFIENMNLAVNAIDKEAFSVVHADLHACHGDSLGLAPSPVEFNNLIPCGPSKHVDAHIKKELYDMILENVLLGQSGGPLRSAAEQAIERRVRAAAAQTYTNTNTTVNATTTTTTITTTPPVTPSSSAARRQGTPASKAAYAYASTDASESAYVRARSLSC